jgi:polyphosphate kinase 2 (PPK2 family)
LRVPDRIIENEEADSSLAALADLRAHLGELQLPQIVHGRRAIILFEGPTGAGKKRAMREVAAAFDPCHFTVHDIAYDRRQSADGHWLARFWRALPSAGCTSIFFRSWYRRVLDDRILRRADETALTRAFDEINEFEAQQRDYGTLIVKLYFEVSPEVQERRLKERAADPWLAVLRRDDAISVADPAYRQALSDLKTLTDTRWSPWRFIDGNDEEEAAISALGAIADVWSKAMPGEPPRLVSAPGQAA